MQELSCFDCEQVGGGSLMNLFSLGIGIITGAGAIREFADGFFDGLGGL